MSLKFTFKNINRVASSNVIRQIIPIYSSRATQTVGIITKRVSGHVNTIGRVSLFPFYLNRLIFELAFLFMCAWVMIIARLGLKVKIIRQGQKSVSMLDRGQFF